MLTVIKSWFYIVKTVNKVSPMEGIEHNMITFYNNLVPHEHVEYLNAKAKWRQYGAMGPHRVSQPPMGPLLLLNPSSSLHDPSHTLPSNINYWMCVFSRGLSNEPHKLKDPHPHHPKN